MPPRKRDTQKFYRNAKSTIKSCEDHACIIEFVFFTSINLRIIRLLHQWMPVYRLIEWWIYGIVDEYGTVQYQSFRLNTDARCRQWKPRKKVSNFRKFCKKAYVKNTQHGAILQSLHWVIWPLPSESGPHDCSSQFQKVLKRFSAPRCVAWWDPTKARKAICVFTSIYLDACRMITSFQDMITNIFRPLFAVTMDPSIDPKLHIFLKQGALRLFRCVSEIPFPCIYIVYIIERVLLVHLWHYFAVSHFHETSCVDMRCRYFFSGIS